MAADNGPFIQGRKYKLPTKDICAVYVGTPNGGYPEFKIDMSAVLDELTPCKEEEEGDAAPAAAANVAQSNRSPANRAKAAAAFMAVSPSAPPANNGFMAVSPSAPPANNMTNVPTKSAAAAPASAPASASASANRVDENASALAPAPENDASTNEKEEEGEPTSPTEDKPKSMKVDYLLKIDGGYYHRLFSNSPESAAVDAKIQPQVTHFINNGVITIEVTIKDAVGTQTKKINEAIVTIGKNEKGRDIATITGGNKVTYFDIAKQAWLDFTDRFRGGSRKTRRSKSTKRSKRTVKKTKKTRRHL